MEKIDRPKAKLATPQEYNELAACLQKLAKVGRVEPALIWNREEYWSVEVDRKGKLVATVIEEGLCLITRQQDVHIECKRSTTRTWTYDKEGKLIKCDKISTKTRQEGGKIIEKKEIRETIDTSPTSYLIVCFIQEAKKLIEKFANAETIAVERIRQENLRRVNEIRKPTR